MIDHSGHDDKSLKEEQKQKAAEEYKKIMDVACKQNLSLEEYKKIIDPAWRQYILQISKIDEEW